MFSDYPKSGGKATVYYGLNVRNFTAATRVVVGDIYIYGLINLVNLLMEFVVALLLKFLHAL